MAVNKVIYAGKTLIDLTGDTVAEGDVKSGITFHKADGTIVEGTNTDDSDTSEDTATLSEILSGKTAHARGAKLTGTMANNGAVSGTIAKKADAYTIPQGYHDGSGTVRVADAEQLKLVPENIKSGITILGVIGTYGGEKVTAEAKTAVPSDKEQIIVPTSADYISQVTVKAIPYVESANSAGGTTAAIA